MCARLSVAPVAVRLGALVHLCGQVPLIIFGVFALSRSCPLLGSVRSFLLIAANYYSVMQVAQLVLVVGAFKQCSLLLSVQCLVGCFVVCS